MFKNVASQKYLLYVYDTTTGQAKTGDAANLTFYLSKDTAAPAVFTTATITEFDSTKSKGWYYVSPSQAETNCDLALVTGVSSTSGVEVIGHMFEMLPANFGALSIDSSGRLDVIKVAGTTQTARDLGASVLLSPGTGTGQLSITSGVVSSNLAQILGTALTETSGLLAAGFKKFFNVASPTGTLNSLPGAVPGASTGLPVVTADGWVDVNVEAINGDDTAASNLVDFMESGYSNVTHSFSTASLAVITSAVWDKLLTNITTVASIGKLLKDSIPAIKTKTDLLPGSVAPTALRAVSAEFTVILPKRSTGTLVPSLPLRIKTDETVTFAVDFQNYLAEGDQLNSLIDLTVSPNDGITITPLGVDHAKAKYTVTAGTASTNYTVVARVGTELVNTYEGQFTIAYQS